MSRFVPPFSGHPRVENLLQRLLSGGEIPSVLLFHGPQGVGKQRFAEAFAKALLDPQHAFDLRLFSPVGAAWIHPIESMKALISEASLPPFAAPYKICVVTEADRMSTEGASVLLNTLEAPHSQVRVILISSRPHLLLPTILSRTFSVCFRPLSDESISLYLQSICQQSPKKAESLARLSQGDLSKAQWLAEEGTALFDLIVALGSDLLFGRYGEILKGVKQLEDYLETRPSIERAEEILSLLFYWYRDLYLIQRGEDLSLIFFKEKEDQLKRCAERGNIPPLEEILEKMDQIYQALRLNIPLTVSLSDILF